MTEPYFCRTSPSKWHTAQEHADSATWTYQHQRAATRTGEYNDAVKQRQDQVLDVEELSEYLKLPKSTVYKLAQEGRIPGQKAGRHWRFLKRAIDDWLERKGDTVDQDPQSGGDQ